MILCQQRGHNTGDENPVKRTRTADRCIRRAEPGNVFHVQQIGADQYAQRSADVRERGALLRTDDQAGQRRADRRYQHWHADAEPLNRAAEVVTDRTDNRDSQQRGD